MPFLARAGALLPVAFALLASAAARDAGAAASCLRVERETPAVFEVVWKVAPENVAALRNAQQKLAEVSGIHPRLAVCGTNRVNAQAIDDAIPEIRVDAGLLKFTDSPDEIAAVLAHEFAHLLMKHRDRKVEAVHDALAEALRNHGTVRTFLEDVTSFSRAAEREADDVGFRLAVKAGFAPGAARAFAARMVKAGFAAGEGYLSTHPGLGERAWYSGRLAANQNFRATAEAQLAQGDVAGLQRTVEAWKAQAPDSGGAAYYGAFAAVMGKRSPENVSAELEDAVSYFGIDDQSILGAEYQVQTRDAAVALCVSLHREAKTVQALNCVKRLRPGEVRQFRDLTGWTQFLVLGRGREDAATPVFGAHLPGGPLVFSSCRRVVQEEGLRRAEPWRAMRAPRPASNTLEATPVVCDPTMCDCRATSLERVRVAQ